MSQEFFTNLENSISDLSFIIPFISLLLVIFSLVLIKKICFNRRIKSDGKAVLITGCDSGFGYEFAKRLDSKGFHVFATCLFPSGPGALELIKCCSSKLNVLHMDVTQNESVEKGYQYVKENLGTSKMWAIVNNAGTARGYAFELCNVEDFEVCLDVNFLGIVRVTKAFLPLLKQTKGRIINVTSIAGEVPSAFISPYTSSKYAAVGLTDCLRLELDAFGVKVASIEPEVFKTGMTSAESLKKLKEAKMEYFDKEQHGEYLGLIDKCVNFFISFASSKVNIVIDDLEDAVSALYPSYTYKPRRNILMAFVFFCYEIMPRYCQVWVSKISLFIISSEFTKRYFVKRDYLK